VAIVQISRITNRKGLTENLPQLSGAELGWCTDSRRLFIGNGTLTDGAPVIGNTEILTEFSDLTAYSFYTYEDIAVGYAAQTGPSPSDPIVRTTQQKLDDFASARDFGCVGDGVTDDTDAIQRALDQLYTREANTQVRRMLYFPAGTYKVTETILVPSFAKLVGEGADCTIIQLEPRLDESFADRVMQYADSLGQVGVNMGSGGAVLPRNIEISSMSFRSTVDTDVVMADSGVQCYFDSVNFVGNVTQLELEDSGSIPLPQVAGVRFNDNARVCSDITFDKCAFLNIAYGIKTSNPARAITVSNSRFETLSQGVVLEYASAPGPTGFRIIHNFFDNIYAEGVIFNNTSLNCTAYNVFYNVGFNIGGSNPVTPVIDFIGDGSVSVNDFFARSDAANFQVPRVQVSAGGSPLLGMNQVQLGRFTQNPGRTAVLANNTTDGVLLEVNTLDVRAFQLRYTMIRDADVRHGVLTVTSGPDDSTTSWSYTDDYTETADVGVTWNTAQVLNVMQVQYDTTNSGFDTNLTYTVSNLA
jgi:hypothetical protein